MNLQNIQGTSALSPQREIIRIKSTVDESNVKLRVAGYARVSSDSADLYGLPRRKKCACHRPRTSGGRCEIPLLKR